MSLVVLGGLVEGTALGLAQAWGLKAWLPRLNLRRWVLVTVAAAGVGWAAGSAPSALSGDDGTPAPPWPMVAAGALTLGAAMGAVLGAAQAPLLHGHVSHPWRWIAANTVAWPPAMAVIFVGATAPGADWSVGAVATLGAVTGAVAGTLAATRPDAVVCLSSEPRSTLASGVAGLAHAQPLSIPAANQEGLSIRNHGTEHV